MVKRAENPEYFELIVGNDQDGRRLDRFLSRRFDRSRAVIQRLLQGQVFSADGHPLKWSHRLKTDEKVLVKRHQHPEPEVEVSYAILLEDEHLVVVNKGPGAPVHPARSFRSRTILTYLRRELDDPGLSPAHRLDRETSGVLVFGRNPQITSQLGAQFAAGQTVKQYLAVVRGQPDFERKRIDAALGPDPNFPIQCRMRVDAAGQPAQTDVEVLWRGPDRALVRARPLSGRQHQIRVHLAHRGHPLLGDKLYQSQGQAYLDLIGGRLDDDALRCLGHVRCALHAESLRIRHPVSKEELHLSAPLPKDLKDLIQKP